MINSTQTVISHTCIDLKISNLFSNQENEHYIYRQITKLSFLLIGIWNYYKKLGRFVGTWICKIDHFQCQQNYENCMVKWNQAVLMGVCYITLSLFMGISFIWTPSTWNILLKCFMSTGTGTAEQGWRSGESARLPPMWLGFDSRTQRHMCVEFVVGSLPCSEGFLRVLRFPPSSKTNTPNSNSISCTYTL